MGVMRAIRMTPSMIFYNGVLAVKRGSIFETAKKFAFYIGPISTLRQFDELFCGMRNISPKADADCRISYIRPLCIFHF